MPRDMMPQFELFQPDSLDGAVELAARLGADGWLLAGGQDSYDWLKNRTKKPRALIDLSGIEALRGVRELAGGGVEIGALTTLTTIEEHPLLLERYGLLCKAAGRVASPQIRNAGTLGGNLCQDTRCWYYRYGVDCYRAGGIMCYADTPEGQNREHAIFNKSRCVADSPSDTATAVTALEGSMVLRSASGERVVPASQFFIGPAADIRHMTVLRPGEILVAVRLPPKWAGATFYFEKVADRAVWDFALTSIAAAFRLDGERIVDASLVCGAVECVPRQLVAVQAALRGATRDAATIDRAAALAAAGAEPLKYNGYKLTLVENLVRRAIRGA